MPSFHRFYSVFPALITVCALFFLGGCAATTKKTSWDSGQSQTAPVISPYPNVGITPSQAMNAPVKVAILLPLSGQKSSMGQSMLQAAQLAVFDTGYDNFELMSFDTTGTASGASTAATDAMSQGAQIILGPVFADEVRAVKSVTAGKGINVLAFSTDWTLAGENTFIMGFLPFGQVERVAAFAAARGLKNTAILSNQDSYGTAATSAFEITAKRHGIFAALTMTILPSHDSAFIPAGGQDLNALISKMPATGIRKLGTGLWDDARLAANPAMNGAWFAAPSPSSRALFEANFKSTYGTPPIRIATLAYDATALCVALTKFGQSRGTGPAFEAASLTNPAGFSGIDGILRFNKNGMADRGLSILEIRNGQIVEIDPAPKRF